MVSKIHDRGDLVLGAKNYIELEAELNMRDIKFLLLYRSVDVFPVHKRIVKPKERRFLK